MCTYCCFPFPALAFQSLLFDMLSEKSNEQMHEILKEQEKKLLDYTDILLDQFKRVIYTFKRVMPARPVLPERHETCFCLLTDVVINRMLYFDLTSAVDCVYIVAQNLYLNPAC